ncbi:hypothetical protein [Ferrimonas sp.]|uniref:hypothetical protein n=1 Tax=Ferrimonas sp. TaxID=2080861 RepID=UPI003A9255CB
MDPVTLTAIGTTLLKAGPSIIRGVGALFGGSTAEVADKVAGITEVVAGKPNPQQQLEQALSQLPPEQLLELKNINTSLEVELARIDAQREANRLKDVQDARSKHRDHWMPALLTVGLFIMMSAVTWALFKLAIPNANRDLVVYVAGQIAGFFATGVGYWLGTSRSSKEKDLAREGSRG